jgi:hypothetical protein
MPRNKDFETRSQSKSEMKDAVKTYNGNKSKTKTSLRKEDIEKSRIELAPKQQELYKMIRNGTITTVSSFKFNTEDIVRVR